MELSCLITLRPTSKFTSLNIITLQEAALNVVLQADVVLKASTTMTYSRAWQAGIISRVSDTFSEQIVCPIEPARPVSNDAMKPVVSRTPEEDALETKKLKSMQKKNTYECTIHAIANAESYAIDLFWDLIARYTVSHEVNAASHVRLAIIAIRLLVGYTNAYTVLGCLTKRVAFFCHSSTLDVPCGYPVSSTTRWCS
jgi:hypothetical protein